MPIHTYDHFIEPLLLTSLMMDHGVAISHKALRIPKVDNDYFEDI